MMEALLEENTNNADLLQEHEETDRQLKHVEQQIGLVDIDGIHQSQLQQGHRDNNNGNKNNNKKSTTAADHDDNNIEDDHGKLHSTKNAAPNSSFPLHPSSSTCSSIAISCPRRPNNKKQRTNHQRNLFLVQIQSLSQQLKLVSDEKEKTELTVKDLKEQIKTLVQQAQQKDKRYKQEESKRRVVNNDDEASLLDRQEQRKLKLEMQILKGENEDLKKEIVQLQSLVKEAETKSYERESRLKQTIKSVQHLKDQLLDKNNTKNKLNSVAKKEISELKTTIHDLEKKNRDLWTCFKKQMQLIDVLKKQKNHLEASRQLDFKEQEFLSALDWKLDWKKEGKHT